VRFEVGDPNLKTESSFNTDVALRVQSQKLQAEVGVFANYVRNYIYPRPTGAFDDESGFQVYDIVQGDARLTGVEAAFEYHASRALHLRGGADYTRGQNTTTNQPLAFVAPLRVSYGARLEAPSGRTFVLPYLSVNAETNARQTRLDPDDVGPEGYTLVHVGAGVGMMAGGQLVRLDVQVRNLFDATYRSFLNRYKLYADDPGRNLIVRMSTSF
jgi:iron complex outermembrane recepter protein